MEPGRLAIGLDFNEPSYGAARWLVQQLGPDVHIILIHVAHVPERPRFLEGLLPPENEFIESATHTAQTRLRDIGASLGTDRLEIVARVGRPAEEIRAAAEEMGADLIAVADRAHRVIGPGGVGSTAEQLLRTAAVPVFLARHLPEGPPRRILIALDESPLSEPVLRWARLLADRFEAAILAFHALSPGLFGSAAAAQRVGNARSLEERFEERTRAWLRERLEAWGLGSARTDLLIAFGDPEYEIVAAARDHDADLVVMGNRGAGSISPALMGGKATAVIRSAPVPVLVVMDRVG